MINCALDAVYSDELFSATDLNRKSGLVLDRALERPVTITRGDHSFALLPREDAAKLMKAASQLKAAFELIVASSKLRNGEGIGSGHLYGWLEVFDPEELSELNAEIHSAVQHCLDAGDWDMFDAVIHEWHESAMAIESPELAAAFSDEIDEVPLTQPNAEMAVA